MAAVTTEAEVCNLALGLVGQTQFIDRLDEPSNEAQICRRYFASTRNDLLEAWHWRFATKRVVLAIANDAAGAPQVRTGWRYCYRSPADLLKAQRIWSGDRTPGGIHVPFTRELDDEGTGHLILTDWVDAQLIYTVELKTVALWPSAFVNALAAQLAVCLAGALPVKPQLMPMLERRAVLAFQRAAALDANEAEPDEAAEAEVIRERY